MSDAEQGAAEEVVADGEAPSKKKKIIVIAAAVVVLLLVAGGAAYFLGLFGGDGGSGVPQAGGAGEAEVVPQREVYFYDLPEMTVNLATQGQATYLKVHISLEVANRSVADQIEPFLPRVIDAFQVYMRELRPIDLEGSAGLFG